MRNSPSLHIFADRVGEKMRREKMKFGLAFSFCFANSTYFENEWGLVKSSVGKILNQKKQAHRKEEGERRINFLLAGAREMAKQANEHIRPVS